MFSGHRAFEYSASTFHPRVNRARERTSRSNGRKAPGMRIALLAVLLAAVCAAVPAAVRAACPALKAAQAMQDAALPSGADVHKLQGTAAQTYVAKLGVAIAKAQTCVGSGNIGDRADALTTISQIRYIQAFVLTHDGVASDRAKAVEIAKMSQKQIDAFRTANNDLSGQAMANLDNWSYWNDKMINKPDEACLGC
jgi:hypothetical protein